MKIVDLKGLSEYTSLSVYTHRKHVKMGLPHYRIGRKILIDLQEFEAWFQQFKARTTQTSSNVGQLVDETLNKLS